MSRWLLARFPSAKKEWADALAVEDGDLTTVVRAFLTAWLLTLKGERPMRIIMTTLSSVNLAAGASLIAMWAFIEDTPALVVALALALITQGGFTIWYLARGSARPLAARLLIVGETLALLVGYGGLLVALVNTIGAIDPEYGPMTVAGLFAAHATAGLYLYVVRGGAVPDRHGTA